MKKYFYILCVLFIAVLGLENCHRDPIVKPKTSNPNDPDSLYQGTPVSFASISPKGTGLFGSPKSTYVDSLTAQGIQLGRRLFYDKHLSLDGHKACATCHQLQYAFSDSGYALSINEFGLTKRNAIALQNLAWAPYYFWDGRQPTIADAAQDASQHEMGLNITNAIAYLENDTVYAKLFKKAFGRPGNVTDTKIYLAIQEFLLSAITYNSRFDSIMTYNSANFNPNTDGYAFNSLFLTEQGDCFHCHTSGGVSEIMTDFKFHNNCLDSAATIYDFPDPGRGGITGNNEDYGKFKSASLRNVAISGPYMHDGRYKTLLQVLKFYSDSLELGPNMDNFMYKHFPTDSAGNVMQHGGMHLTPSDIQDFLVLLNDLTDTSFMNNPNLKSPF